MGFEDTETLRKHIEFMRQKDKEYKEMLAEEERKRQEKLGFSTTSQPQKPQYFDHPNTMENLPATLLYIFVMIGGSIFTDRVLIWVGATVWWFVHINRHNIKK